MPYSPLLVKPFRDELTVVGVKELTTPESVDEILKENGVTMIVVNSVCGCAAGSARPAVKQAMEHDKKPNRVASVFAGQDLEATARFRSHIADIPPSSPSIALFKDQELVYFVPKHRIEGRDATALANDLKSVFDEFC
ncbi:BrxA/BrxB family bacilliredoxin [Chitinophaga sp. RAB17]|uniref:BrxA/BrxB family bacilliredoxin n=1 Tax=Chitinophaga sp. RAB17 TaxID=3233049 RepID=UPI003F932DB1